ncbi:Uu.00g137650.m01.CDS01 [Anthostomella pinea]|uniref:Uu.00g137650.m01.CDS01 n=1 Tax=Anthostomella pinea TaxID=933095 RepID=A0AAI8VQ73_9PEZI|nr:Uu.00g137650.m01.CDS01 [Anthostomella pinea]
MDTSAKRKHDASNGSRGPPHKRSRGGGAGKWQTPHHKARIEAMKGRSLEVGDTGVWVTCVRHKEMQAIDEMVAIFHEYGDKLYGIKSQESGEAVDEEEVEDIESSIKNELEGMTPANKPKHAAFEPMRTNLDCLLFMKTREPVDPIHVVREICKDAAATTSKTQWRSRFINKFTPITYTGKATEKGVDEVAKRVLRDHFQLKGDEGDQAPGKEGAAYSYAIRPSFRAHNTLKRTDVITQVAELIAPEHKVNLTTPDKVILIDIYQTFCGMSVVNGDWDAMKRYNLHELYLSAAKSEDNPEEAKGEPLEKLQETAEETPKEKTQEEPQEDPAGTEDATT